ncbi:MAG: CHAT domain-containing protein [Isosphaeraceae bacterium]
MRFQVCVDERWNLTITAGGPAGKKYSERTLVRKVNAEGDCLPMPPDLPAGKPREVLCPHLQPGGNVDELFAIRQRIADRDYGTDLKDFGLYLFDTLIGKVAWAAISADAKANPMEKLIELALCWPAGDDILNRLNWELMHGPDEDGFLAAGRRSPVAITRLVAKTDKADWEVRPISYPPRVLFVLGTPWTETGIRGIRPATECLALLNQLRWNGHSIQSLVLHRARPERIKERIKSFRPHIVHFLCHGQPAADGAPAALILEKDDPDEDRTDVAAYEADQILGWLNVDQTVELPAIVVLSACHTADSPAQAGGVAETAAVGSSAEPSDPPDVRMWGGHQTAPLAARLVEGRVPIVVGMAGEVSDRGCRLFTRRFGEALLEGRSLVAAATQARSAALSEGERAYRSADWALPALFMAQAVDPGFVPVLLPDSSSAGPGCPGVDERINVYDVERKPVFCGRDEFFAAYHELFHPVKGRQYSVVAAYSETVDKGMGHSRLLLELTAQAVRDHHIPCLIGSDDPNWEPPRGRLQLAAAFYEAISKARKAFLRSVAFPSQLDLLRVTPAKKLRSCRKLDPDVWASLGKPGDELSVDALRMALKKDLDMLRGDVIASCPDVAAAGGRLLFLLDKVDQYADALDDLLAGLLGPYGLTATGPLVPVIMTLTASGSILQAFARNVERHRPWLRPMRLKPFERNGEDFLAYERVLLHPFLDRPERATKAWVINWEADLASLEEFHKDYLRGIPGLYGLPLVYSFLLQPIKDGIILPADDSDFLKGMPNLS